MTKEDQGLLSNYNPIKMVNSVVLNISYVLLSIKQVYEISKSLHAVSIYILSLTFFGIGSLLMLKLTQNKSTFLHKKQTDMSKPSVEHLAVNIKLLALCTVLLHLCSTCMPCAGDRRALMKCSVLQGAKSPISTCLFWSLEGTGRTFQSGSLLICVVLSRKLGRSPVRSSWAFLDTLSCRI